MKKIACIVFLIALMVGCASRTAYRENMRSRIDPAGFSNQNFEADHELCTNLAYDEVEKVRTKRAVGAGIGAVVGATIGLATSAILGRGAGSKVGQKAMGLGALYGAGAGAASPKDHAAQIYGNCMINRGYQILY